MRVCAVCGRRGGGGQALYPIAFGLPATVPGLRQDGCCHGPSTLPKYALAGPVLFDSQRRSHPGGSARQFFFRLWNHVSRRNGTPQQVPNPCRIWSEIHEKWGPKSPKSLKIELWGPLGGPGGAHGLKMGEQEAPCHFLAPSWPPFGAPMGAQNLQKSSPEAFQNASWKKSRKLIPKGHHFEVLDLPEVCEGSPKSRFRGFQKKSKNGAQKGSILESFWVPKAPKSCSGRVPKSRRKKMSKKVVRD